MAGLLIKDYYTMRGKQKLAALGGFWLLLFVVRFVLIPTFAPPDASDRQVDRLAVETILVTLYITIDVFLYLYVIWTVVVNLMKADDGRKTKQYYLSLPVSHRQYVQSKYIFFLIVCFVLHSFTTLASYMVMSNMVTEQALTLIVQFSNMQISLTCLTIFLAALELPFYFALGAKKGKVFKEGLAIGLFFIVVIYMMFGDLELFEKIGLLEFCMYLGDHPMAVTGVILISPILSLPSFYVSYRLSVGLSEKRGDNHE